jgi:hypothetical protein
MRAMRIGGAATVLALGTFIFVMLRDEKRRAWLRPPAASHQPPAFAQPDSDELRRATPGSL